MKPTTSQSKAERSACIIVALLGLLICLAQLWRIHAMWTPVGYVDAWPLYDRLMKLREGHLSLDHYFFDPHGPHLHSIVYLLYLLDVMCASGRQLVPHFATMFSIIGLAATLTFAVARSYPRKTPITLRFCVLLFGMLILLSGVSEATAIPFQAVVVVSKFVYFLLLSVLVWCQVFPNKWLHMGALAASCVAASFYAASGIFALELLLLHLIFFRNWRPMLCSVFPLVSYLWLIGHYLKPLAETEAMTNVLRSLNVAAVCEIGLSTISYYASALALGWPRALNPKFGVSEVVLLTFAVIVCATTVIWAAYSLVSLALRVRRGLQLIDATDCASCIMALLSLFVFASSLSAALLWVARARVFGAALGMPAHFAVLTSSRYAAFASIAFIVFLYISVNIRHRYLGTVIASTAFVIVAVCAFNTLSIASVGGNRDSLEYSATALLMGMSPADDEASAVWPGVRADWYWPTELQQTAAYLQAAGISYAYRMPAVGQFSGGPTVRIYEYAVAPVAENSRICRLTGRVATFDTENPIAPLRFFPITTIHNEVVGYAVRTGNAVKGHLLRVLPGEPVQAPAGEMQTTAVNLTDANWRNGIWIASKVGMFFISGTDDAGKKVARGDRLIFAKSGARNVVHVGKGSPSTVAIEVGGPSLDPEGDGYPNVIKFGRGDAADRPLLFLSRRD